MLSLTQICVTLTIFIVVTQGLRCNYGTCSKNNDSDDMEGNVLGGTPTTIQEFPHAVYLSMVYQNNLCGSSILNQWVLVSAAHCVANITGKFKIDAYAGHENLYKVPLIRSVNKFLCHKHYDMVDGKQFDIALLFLDKEMPLKSIAPKRVVISNRYPYDLQTAEMAGWGESTGMTKEEKVTLRKTDQKIIDLNQCSSYPPWRRGLLCAGDSVENRPHKGDSGSGLLTKNYQLIGVVAFRVSTIPEMIFYTNVTYYYDWIVNEVKQECAQAG